MSNIPTFFGILLSLSFITALQNVEGKLSPPEKSYKILAFIPYSSQSHRNVFLPILQKLAERGHEITILSPFPPSRLHKNFIEIQHGINVEADDMFKYRSGFAGGMAMLADILPVLGRELYKVPAVRKLYENRDKYDLFLIDEMFNEVAYPFLLGKVFIAVAASAPRQRFSSAIGNVLNPAYVPAINQDFPHPLTFFQRVVNTYWHLHFPIYWRLVKVVPLIQKEISIHFPDLPPLLEIERNVSLELVNDHYAMSVPFPMLPSQIPIGPIQCGPSKPLPEDLSSWIEAAGPSGVIYFSLGSMTKGTSLPPHHKDQFIEAFRQMKQRVLWKYEGEIPNLPENVMIQKWLPQQDILAHPSVKVFITHGGMLSFQESLYHGTRLMALPIYGDQPKNARHIFNMGYGLYLSWEELTVKRIVQTLTELMENPKYMNRVAEASRALKDQIEPPQERAVWWIEYVIRHGGVPRLRSPAADLSWIENFLLDIIFCLLLAIFVIYYLVKKIICVLIRNLLPVRQKPIKKKRE